MSSDQDNYCSKCDVFGHYEGSVECQVYYASVEIPFQERMQKMVGKIFKLRDPAPMLFIYGTDEQIDLDPGTFVRLTAWTPYRAGFKAGDYWTIETLDKKAGATQIYSDELEELNALDKLSLIKEEQ